MTAVYDGLILRGFSGQLYVHIEEGQVVLTTTRIDAHGTFTSSRIDLNDEAAAALEGVLRLKREREAKEGR
jgi:hypothetical protein